VQLKAKAGLALVAIGIGVFASWKWWSSTRNLVPVNLPMPLTAGERVTASFKLNYDGLYLIEITAEPRLPPEALRCLLGVEADAVRCKDAPSPIAADWIVSSDDHGLRRGNSNELHSGPAQSQTVTRVIGEFPGRAGETYNLQVNFAGNAQRLATTNPRVRLAVASMAYTDLESAGVLVLAAAFVCVMFGAVLLSVAWFAKTRGLTKIAA
jgi:hypothetical protein